MSLLSYRKENYSFTTIPLLIISLFNPPNASLDLFSFSFFSIFLEAHFILFFLAFYSPRWCVGDDLVRLVRMERSNRWDTSLEQLGVGSPIIMLGDRTN